MPFCPRCRAEYRIGFTRCAECDVSLVERLDQAAPAMDELAMAEYLANRELVVIVQADVERLKPLKNLLCENSIANIIVRLGSGDCCSGGGCGPPKLDLAVAVEDVERALGLLKEEFKELVVAVTDGEDEIDRLDRALDLNGETMTCPACDGLIPSGFDECPSCGLYIGVPEELLSGND